MAVLYRFRVTVHSIFHMHRNVEIGALTSLVGEQRAASPLNRSWSTASARYWNFLSIGIASPFPLLTHSVAILNKKWVTVTDRHDLCRYMVGCQPLVFFWLLPYHRLLIFARVRTSIFAIELTIHLRQSRQPICEAAWIGAIPSRARTYKEPPASSTRNLSTSRCPSCAAR